MFLNKIIIERIIENEDFSFLNLECPECSHIEDEQYTCTKCWAEGGRSPISMQNFIENLFTFKYKSKISDYDLETLKTFKSFYQGFDIIYLYHDEYYDIIPETFFDFSFGYVTISIEDILNFLID